MSTAARLPSPAHAIRRSQSVAIGVGSVAVLMAVGAVTLATANGVTLLAALEDYAVPTLAVGVSLAVVGTVVAVQRPRLPLGWYLQIAALACLMVPLAAQWARAALVTHAANLPGGSIAAAVAAFGWPVSAVLLFAGLPLVFPEGRPVGRVAWAGAVAAGGALVTMALGSGFAPGPSANLPEISNPLGVDAGWPAVLQASGVLLALIACVLATVSLVLRYRRAGHLDRIRIRTFVAAAVLLALSETALPGAMLAAFGTYPDRLHSLAETVFGAGLVVAVGVAVLRHHLHGIDVAVNRTAVYSVMTVVVTAVYVIIVGYAAAALDLHGTAPEVAATIVAALCFEPVRRRVQTGINRLFYGQREDPGRLIVRLDGRLEGAESVDAVLAAVAETAAEGLRLPYVAVRVESEDASEHTVTVGAAAGGVTRFPVSFGRTRVGAVEVGARRSERGLGEADRRALLEYARHAAPALYAARLSGELVGAQARIVHARETERRRIRRELHDGLGADLGSQAIFLDAIRRLVRTDPERVERLLLDARKHTQEAVTDLRRVLDDLRPAVLDDHGLVAALQALVDRYEGGAVRVEIDALLEVEPPPAVQAALLRIITESVANAVQHSGGTRCLIHLTGTGSAVELTVSDDGRGLSGVPGSGVGLRSMHERAAEVGGTLTVSDGTGDGVLVSARIPIGKETL